jgi:hypothetical protein
LWRQAREHGLRGRWLHHDAQVRQQR